MGFSRVFKEKIDVLSAEDLDRLVRMGWEDRTAFETIRFQFGLSENEFIKLMRRELGDQGFQRWRRRIGKHGHLKHEKKNEIKSTRFKCTRQNIDGSTKGWK